MKKPLVMTPGPTTVHEEVRMALAREATNPDLDPDFFEFYRSACDRLKELMETRNDVLILCGEGILGLEAACASLLEEGDRVLCISNGIFGDGFGDFAKLYGAEVVFFKADYRKAVDVQGLKDFLAGDHDFKLATLVHCETPSGITNPVSALCPLLKSYGILTVVDSVSAVGGEELKTDLWGMDVVIGGSQKCLSAPPGLTFLSISEEAWDSILNRKKQIAGFYTNLSHWRNWYREKWFPYTQPANNISALNKAAERLLSEEDRLERHRRMSSAVRSSIVSAGLELYPQDGFANTVTTITIPEGISFKDLFGGMLEEHGILIAGAFDFLKDKVMRIGHMGENCREDKLYITLKALDRVLRKHGIPLECELHKAFADYTSS